MKRKLLFAGAAVLASAAALTAVLGASAQEGPPPAPSAGSSIASGLPTTGGTIGPDGALYVAIAGSGGDTVITFPPDIAEAYGADQGYFGFSGNISRVDPGTGEVTVYAPGLPSGALEPDGEGTGASDVTFLNGTAYALITGGLNYVGG